MQRRRRQQNKTCEQKVFILMLHGFQQEWYEHEAHGTKTVLINMRQIGATLSIFVSIVRCLLLYPDLNTALKQHYIHISAQDAQRKYAFIYISVTSYSSYRSRSDHRAV